MSSETDPDIDADAGAAAGGGDGDGAGDGKAAMHIKRVVISGFRSYRNEVIVNDFDPGHNVVVGRNGTGKSNFFNAIRFVLSDEYSNMRQEDRQGLIHEGTGATVMSAFVEIVFDNSQRRFHVDGDEVVLRRTIGLKKDEYFLNHKHFSRTDVINLLESAGFSRSNPYYIVQQGKVNKLCTMKDSERLELLKEVAGTSVYDERRLESLKVLKETDGKRAKINEVISFIEEKLEQLEEEKAELAEFQKLDRQRRALEISIANEEMERATTELEAMEERQQQEAAQSGRLRMQALETQNQIAKMEADIETYEQQVNELREEKSDAAQQSNALLQKRMRLEHAVTNLQERAATAKTTERELRAERAQLERKIEEVQGELDTVIEPQLKHARETNTQLQLERSNLEAESQHLLDKAGRQRQFTSRKDRDRVLAQRIEEEQHNIQTKTAALKAARQAFQAATEEIEAITAHLEAKQLDLQNYQTSVQTLSKSVTEVSAELQALDEQRRQAWAREGEIAKQMTAAQDILKKAKADLDATKPRALRTGLDFIERHIQHHGSSGVHGQLIDLFACDSPGIYTAVEVTARDSLFHLIVDTEDTAAGFVSLLERSRAGRVTFMPLDRIAPPAVSYPTDVGNDAVPLIERLQFDEDVRVAMQHVFGRTMLCRNREVASRLAAETGLDCVTLEGDMVDRKGVVQGGFRDRTTSRLHAWDSQAAAHNEILQLNAEDQQVKEQSRELDQKLSQTRGTLERHKGAQGDAKAAANRTTMDMDMLKKRLAARSAAREEKQRSAEDLQGRIEVLEKQVQALQAEMATEMQTTLSAAETARLSEITAEMARLAKQISTSTQDVERLSSKQSKLQAQLQMNLSKRLSEIDAALSGQGTAGGGDHLESEQELTLKQQELEAARKAEEAAAERGREAAKKFTAMERKLQGLMSDLEALRTKDATDREAAEQESKNLEKMLGKRNMLVRKREECLHRLTDLGARPTEEIAAISRLRPAEWHNRLRRVNEELKKFAHVNKKAMDQFVSFNEQRADLERRKEELDLGQKSISQLIDGLDQRKDEAILQTFKHVAMNFEQVFRQLSGGGVGTIVMLRRTDQDRKDADDEPAADGAGGMVSNFKGVAVKVSFVAGTETVYMSQLSGGQKAIVALALIFAIQRCDPAPFYLFDEIDQALDQKHREAVARMVAEQARRGTQFITSTFHPELVNVADKCFGVTHQNKISSIIPQTLAEAREFVESISRAEMAAGAVSASAMSPGPSKRARTSRSGRKSRGTVADDADDRRNTTAAGADSDADPDDE